MGHNRKIKKTSLAVQSFNLKRMFPNSDIHVLRNCLTWTADLKPSALSDTYTAQLTYKLNQQPEIHVLRPKLIVPERGRLPHTYSGNRLCLYYPGIGEWRGNMLLTKSVVPWISEWLVNYEIWLATGKWCGGV